MKRSHLKKIGCALFCTVMMVGAFMLFGCEGDTGPSGPPGATGATGPPGQPLPGAPVITTGESCDVCHAAGKIADIAVAHPDPTGLDVTLSDISLTNTGGFPVVSFHAETAEGPVTDLIIDDFQFMIADLVPAGTDTDWGNWPTSYFERWARERVSSSDPVGVLDTTDAVNGNYTYTFATAFGSDDALAEAPDYNPADTQRLAIIVSGRNDPVTGLAITNNTVGFLDFVVPDAGSSAVPLGSQRLFVTAEACKLCHSPLFQQAAHADTYLDTRTCVICHSPLGHYGDIMQRDDAYLPVLMHQIHAAIDNPAFEEEIRGKGFGAVTFPQNQEPDVYEGVEKCVVCHTDSGLNLGTGNEIDHWKTHPTAEICGSCHVNVDFATGENHPGGAQTNDTCTVCHPASGFGFGMSVTDAHDTTLTGNNVPEFDVTITITAPKNGMYYVEGEAPEVLVTLDNHSDGLPVDPGVYTASQDNPGNPGGGLSEANLYVYGSRAKSVPVLATGTTSDPNFDSATDTPIQGHELFVDSSDPKVTTDSSGFSYQLLPIPAGMKAGTYMVRFEGADYGGISDTNYVTSSTALINFQVGTDVVEEKVAGDGCINCHGDTRMHLTGAHPHNVPFNTDYCLACHDQSGNYAIPLANRVHAVHDANPEGDIFVFSRGGDPASRDWSVVTYPQNIQIIDGLPRCVGCHNSGDTTYKTMPYMMPCVGCHTVDGDIDHIRQNGGPF